VEVPNHASLSRRLQGDTWMGWQVGEHVHAFERPTLLRLVERAGLAPVAVRNTVPGWEGMLVEGYAHLLGLYPALTAGLRVKRTALAWLGHRRRDAAEDTGVEAWPPSVPIREKRGLGRLLYTTAFTAVARAEERVGWGSNLRIIARPRNVPAT